MIIKEKKIKKQKGITLIALAITIIVLLILAGVTIAMLMGDNGLLNMASRAAEETKIGKEKETIELSAMEAKVDDSNNDITDKTIMDSIFDRNIGLNKFETEKVSKGLVVTYVDTGRTYLIENDGNVSEYDYNDYIGTLEYYTNRGEISIGDYFEYQITNNPYIISDDKSGYTEPQEFTSTSYTGMWRVLYNGSDEYGIQIVSNKNVLGDKKIQLNGKVGYNNIVEVLNSASGNYIDKRYALSARALGSHPSDTETSLGNQIFISDSKPNFLSDLQASLVHDYKVEDDNYKYDASKLSLYKNNTISGLIFASRTIRVGYHFGGEVDFLIRGDLDGKGYYELAWYNSNGVFANMDKSVSLLPVIKLREDVKVMKTYNSNGEVVWKFKI